MAIGLGAINVGCIFVYFKGKQTTLVPDIRGEFDSETFNAQPIILEPGEWTPVPINETLKESLQSGALKDLNRRDLLIFANSESEMRELDKEIAEEVRKNPDFLESTKKIKAISPQESAAIRLRYGTSATAVGNLVERYRKEENLDIETGKPLAEKPVAESKPVDVKQDSETITEIRALSNKLDVLTSAIFELVKAQQKPLPPKPPVQKEK